MAIGTFAELKVAAANWLDRSDLTDRIPEFISLAEARFNRILRIRDMETVSTAISTAAGTREYDLPTGFVQMKEFHLTTDPLTPLAYITPEMMSRTQAGSSKSKPQVFTIIADKVRDWGRILMPSIQLQCFTTKPLLLYLTQQQQMIC